MLNLVRQCLLDRYLLPGCFFCCHRAACYVGFLHEPALAGMMWTRTAAILLACGVFSASAATRTYNLTLHSGERSPGQSAFASDCLRIPYTANKLADGFARQVYLINGQQPGPLIEANQGDILEVTVFNDLDVENTIHWHGACITPDLSSTSAPKPSY